MKVLLVNPQFPNTYWSFRHALSFEGKRAAFPPLGLLTVSALLPETWERRLIDMNIKPLKARDIEWADIVLATGMLVQKEALRQVVDRCKAHGKRVAIGGPYVTTGSENLPAADHIFIGEAESTLPLFIQDLEHGTTQPVYRASEWPSLDLTPVPDFDLVDFESYSSISVQYSRGCPFHCEFCDITEIYGRVPRTKSPAQMIAELEALRQTGWRGSVFIVDDNFIGNKRQVRLLLPELAAWQERHGMPFTFLTEASVNLAEDDELLEGMHQAGFRSVFLGIETPVESSLREAHKLQNTRASLLDSVRKIQLNGLQVMGGFIVGFDSDPVDIFERQIDFIRKSAIPLAMVGLLNALPDTQLWRRLKREGRLIEESSGDNTSCALNFVPKMDPARLVEGYRSLMRTIYGPAEFYQRAIDSLRRLPANLPASSHRGLFDGLAAFFRIVFKLGLLDRQRMESWQYLAHALFITPRRFADAMTLAAMGYHLRTLTEGFGEQR